jgi:hypothetical protein
MQAPGDSAMSDYNRTVTSSPFGRATGRTSIAIDEGLRAYMLHVYNYMVLGLAFTGLAALGIYMASVTGDPGAAARILRNGVEVPARIANNMYLTSIGYTMFVSPVKWNGVRTELWGREASACNGAVAVLDFRSLDGFIPRLDLHGLHAYFDRAGVLHHCGVIWGAKPLGVYDAT